MTAEIIDFQAARESRLAQKEFSVRKRDQVPEESVPQEQQAHADIEQTRNDNCDYLDAQTEGWTSVTLLDFSEDEFSEPEEIADAGTRWLVEALETLHLPLGRPILASPRICRELEEFQKKYGS